MIQPNPLIKLGEMPVRFRDSNGRFSKPARGAYFEIKIKGKQKPLTGEIPKESRRSQKSRLDYIASKVLEWSQSRPTIYNKQRRLRELKREEKKVKEPKQKTKVKKQIDNLEESIFKFQTKEKEKLKKVKAKPLPLKEKSRLKSIKTKENDLLDKAGLVGIKAPINITKLKSSTSYESKQLMGRPLKEKRPDSRVGTPVFVGRTFEIEKKSVNLAAPVDVNLNTPSQRKAAAVLLREYFRKYAEDFALKHKDKSTNAFIMRLKVNQTIQGQKAEDTGYGTERFVLRRNTNIDDYLELLSGKIDQLFGDFASYYEGYLQRDVYSNYQISGFTMEVVKNVIN